MLTPRRSRPPTPLSNMLMVLGIGYVPPVSLGLLFGSLDREELGLITAVNLTLAGLVYGVSWVAYRGRCVARRRVSTRARWRSPGSTS